MCINRGLIGPVLVQQKDFRVSVGMINFKSETARLLSRQSTLLRQQALNLGDVIRIFDR